MRIIIKFEKLGANRFISHLDLMRALQRALRRAQLPIAYSQGFNPRMILSFAAALSLGAESRGEVLEMRLQQNMDPSELIARFNAALPQGIHMLCAREIPQQAPALTALLAQARYTVRVQGDCAQAVNSFWEAESCVVSKPSKKGVREVDIKPMVYALDARAQGETTVIDMTLEHTASNALNPELLLRALGIRGGERVMRTGLYGIQNGAPVNLYDWEFDS